MGLLIQLALWVFFGVLGGQYAGRKGYPVSIGILMGAFGGPITWLVAWALPVRGNALREQTWKELEAKRKACPECEREVALRTPVCPRCNYRFANRSTASTAA